MCRITRLVISLCFFWLCSGFTFNQPELLPVDKAFPFSVNFDRSDARPTALIVEWDITDGYYLYQKKFSFKSTQTEINLGSPRFPESETKTDEYFGEVKIHRGTTRIRIPVSVNSTPPSQLELTLGYQGCADIGICYPPQTQTISVQWPKTDITASSTSAQVSPFSNILNKLGVATQQSVTPELLPSDQAFQLFAEVLNADRIGLSWRIAPDYYLYRQKFSVRSLTTDKATIGNLTLPKGKPKFDAEYGQVEVFYDDVNVDIPIQRASAEPFELELEVDYQGCAEIGVCYPPISKTVSLQILQGESHALPVETISSQNASAALSEQDQIASALQNDQLWWTGLLFLGFGLMLAFTPCCFPMIPILAGIIVGHGEKTNTWHAFWLSLSYVLGSAVTYTIFGVLAGLFGSNLQALFQNPWLLGAFSAVFVFLALSMFGLFELQLPSSLQSRLNALSHRQKSGSFIGAAIMGMLSALIVGPCVAAPLAGALIYIGKTGDAVLGGFALFMMALGMGIPLLAVGTSAGKLLPRVGAWMGRAKIVFGFIMLGVAIWLLERVLPPALILFMWALLLISSGVYLGALDRTDHHSKGYRRLFKSFGIAVLAWGLLLLIGAASGAADIFKPLERLSLGHGGSIAQTTLEFQRVGSESELETVIAKAAEQGQWVMLDYYADWCISCKEMERDTFSDPKVQQALSRLVLLKADVTRNNADDKALLARFGLIGPPATLFFGSDQQERKAYRIVGYKDASDFIRHLQLVLKS